MDFYGQTYEELLAEFDAKKWSALADIALLEDCISESSAGGDTKEATSPDGRRRP